MPRPLPFVCFVGAVSRSCHSLTPKPPSRPSCSGGPRGSTASPPPTRSLSLLILPSLRTAKAQDPPPVPQFTACLSEPSPGARVASLPHPPPPTGLWGDHRMRSGGVQGPWESFRHRTDDRNVQRRVREAGGGALTSGKTGDVLLGPQLGGHVHVTKAWHRANTAMLSL